MLVGRYRELDALRGLAAVAVVIFHYPQWFLVTLSGGFSAVDVFFVLSGFVLTHRYLTEIQSRRTPFLTFLRDRLARLAPLHLFALGVVVVMVIFFNHSIHENPYPVWTLSLQAALLYCLIPLSFGLTWNAPSWTISAEILANILWYFMPRRNYQIVSLVVSATCFAAIWYTQGDLRVDTEAVGPFSGGLVRAIAGILIGSIVYLNRHHFEDGLPLRLTFVAAATMFLMFLFGGVYRYPGGDFLIPTFCAPVMILGATNWPLIRKTLDWPPLVFVGTISYSIYLMHFPVAIAAVSAWHNFEWTRLSFPQFGLAYLGATILVSTMTYRLVEIPAQRAFKSSRTSTQLASNTIVVGRD